jgi:hypothetical protein
MSVGLLGPDGIDYPNEIQLIHYALLRLCGCGDPAEAHNVCRDVLECFDRRDPLGVKWINAPEAAERIVRERPGAAVEVLAHLFTHLGLLEHGGAVGGSWLTDNVYWLSVNWKFAFGSLAY